MTTLAPAPSPCGLLFVISAPSGAGKTSLSQALVAGDDTLIRSVSHTTRSPRPGERDGVDYQFVDLDAFQAMQAAEAFLEQAEVFGNHYGTSRDWVAEQLNAGTDVLLEIDWQGARQVRATLPACRSIFILPPSRQALRQRLEGRNSDARQTIDHRMAAAVSELTHWAEYDYVVVNDDFDQALQELRAIVQACRLGRAVQGKRHRALISALLETPSP